MNDKKILIAYYSLQGNTRELAKNIQEVTGGDIFEIQLVKPYNLATAGTIGLIHAKTGSTPLLKNHITNIDDYDVVFIGSPIWWFTIAPPIMSFIKEYNLEGKTIIPFCTHRGDFGDYFVKLKNQCLTSKVMEGNDFHNGEWKDKEKLKNKVKKWVLKSVRNW